MNLKSLKIIHISYVLGAAAIIQTDMRHNAMSQAKGNQLCTLAGSCCKSHLFPDFIVDPMQQ